MRINRLLQEHRVIARAGDELLRMLNDVADEAVVLREDVETAVATYLVYYRHHLATEEREIMPRAATLLTAQDWSAVAAAAPVGRDPETRHHTIGVGRAAAYGHRPGRIDRLR